MNVETKQVKLSALKLNPNNPRRIGNKEMERLVKSLQEFPDMLSIREIEIKRLEGDENRPVPH